MSPESVQRKKKQVPFNNVTIDLLREYSDGDKSLCIEGYGEVLITECKMIILVYDQMNEVEQKRIRVNLDNKASFDNIKSYCIKKVCQTV